MLRTLLVCGLLAGVTGGVLVTGFAQITGEPTISRAEAFEYAQAAARHDPPEVELVPRNVQRSFGLLTAAVVYGLSFGGLFALTFAAVYGRVGRMSPARTALWLAAVAFVVLYLVPFVKYPANPPSVGDPDTIQRRTALYLVMMGSSLLAALAAVRVRMTLAQRVSGEGATLLACVLYLVVVIAAGLALPGIHEVPRGFPADTLFRFRESSIGLQLVMWTTIGLVFAGTARRAMSGQRIVPRLADLRGLGGGVPAEARRD
jgi:peptidoglycan/LPS O-acetylase OafA/YrhL